MAVIIRGNQSQAQNDPQPTGRPSSRPPPSINEINNELIHIPITLLARIKQELGIPQDKDLATMTNEERYRIFALYRGNYRNQTQPGPDAPQQPPNGPSLTPFMTPPTGHNAGSSRSNPTNPAPATLSAPTSTGAETTPGLIDLQQPGMRGLGDLTWGISDFDQTFLRQDPGDLNFERDFGQWFNPGGDAALDMQ